MHTYLITPHAPLVLRTGKPFGETGGGESFTFPLPSTVAGALRTARADALRLNFRDERRSILGWAAPGALPVEIDANGKVSSLFPRPLDTFYTAPKGKRELRPMTPLDIGTDEGCDLPHENLLPVLLPDNVKSKAVLGPAWWTLAAMTEWLLGSTPNAQRLGPEALQTDTRTHVSIEPHSFAASSGQLFQSSGPDFEARRLATDREIAKRGWQANRFGLLAQFEEELSPTLIRLGGEGRLASLTPSPDSWPEPPPELESALEHATRVRLVLTTPALFMEGWRPS